MRYPVDEDTIQGEETIQGRKLYEEIRYADFGCLEIHLKKFPFGNNIN